MSEPKDKFSKDDFKNIIFSDNTKIRKQFQDAFTTEINDFIEAIFNAYEAQELLDKKCRNDKQKTYTAGFLFNAIKNLVGSFSLLISGYMVPSGNLMRHSAESLAMALLTSNKSLNYFERLQSDLKKGKNFPVHKSLKYVLKHAHVLKIDSKKWSQFIDLFKFYDNYSHASLLSLSDIFDFARSGDFSIGPNYDSDSKKQEIYRIEINHRINMANFLKNVIKKQFLNKEFDIKVPKT